MLDSSKNQKTNNPNLDKKQSELAGLPTNPTGTQSKEKSAVSVNPATKSQGTRAARKPLAAAMEKCCFVLACCHSKVCFSRHIQIFFPEAKRSDVK